MKELSIEQKAKAYDEALERARKLKENPQQVFYEYSPKEGETIADYIFPELKELEDERIRKVLVELVKCNERCGYFMINNITTSAMLAWLEKQEGCEYIKKDWLEHIKQSWYKEGFIDGKYTPKELTINDATTLNELIDFLENGTAKLQHDLTLYANWLKTQFSPNEKQGEQKPDKVEPKFKVGDLIRNKWSNHSKEIVAVDDCQYTLNDGMPAPPFKVAIKEQDNWELVEQKPTWSEEDENRINHLIAYFEDKEGFTAEDDIVYANWLKSLKQRLGGKL